METPTNEKTMGYADEIVKQCYDCGIEITSHMEILHSYARGLEFALECIGKGMKPNSDFPCAFCDSKKPHIHTAGDEAKLAVKEEKFAGHLHGPANPCGKPFCKACYPLGAKIAEGKYAAGEIKISDGPRKTLDNR